LLQAVKRGQEESDLERIQDLFPNDCLRLYDKDVITMVSLFNSNLSDGKDVTTVVSLTLLDFQLDAQNSYLFTCNTFIKILYMFREFSSFLTGAQQSHLQRVTIPEAAYIQLRRRPPEDEQGNARNM
jgi:hypothetical protein